MKFSSTLKELREQNHVTQNELASHLKLTRSTIAGYETKESSPIMNACSRLPITFMSLLTIC